MTWLALVGAHNSRTNKRDNYYVRVYVITKSLKDATKGLIIKRRLSLCLSLALE